MSKDNTHTITGQDYSMNCWAHNIKKKIDEHDHYANALLNEEYKKKERLLKLAKEVYLPIYEVRTFTVPDESDIIMDYCRAKIKDGWKLSVRIMDQDEKDLLFRSLDETDINLAINKVSGHKAYKATVSPYKNPTISGTITMRSNETLLEMVYGPHYWLTKYAPDENDIIRCSYGFPHLSLKYSTNNPNLRSITYRVFKDMIHILCAMEIHQLSERELSVYAEFVWHESIGYKFFECSYSRIWTGNKENTFGGI